MTREEAEKLLPFIQAYAEGKKVEFYFKRDEKWVPCSPNCAFNPDFEYRIAPEKQVRYVNIYKHDSHGFMHDSRRNADLNNHNGARVACIRIEYTGGQYDD